MYPDNINERGNSGQSYTCSVILMIRFMGWVMVFKATKQYFSYIVVVSFYWWRKPGYPENTTDLSQVTDKLYHIMLYRDEYISP
jgi:hypothetical protein